jgi:serine/threonine-protein kinase
MRLAGATIFLGVALGASVTILARVWHAGPAPGEAGVPQLIEAPRPDASPPANASPPQGVADAAVRVEAAPGKAPASRVRKGRLTLRVSPWAEVSIDGRKLGTTPLSPIELGEGRHSVVLVNPELGVRRTLTATVRDGRDVTLRVNLLE